MAINQYVPKNKRNVETPQTVQARPEQVQNNAGGYVWAVSDDTALLRFLAFGSASTYYQKDFELTESHAEVILKLMRENGPRVAQFIEDVNRVTVDENGLEHPARVAKKTYSIFALALLRDQGDEATRIAVYSVIRNGHVMSTLPQMYEFLHYVWQFNNGHIKWSSGLQRAIAHWLVKRGEDGNVDWLAYQFLKYRNRNFTTGQKTHNLKGSDLLRMLHVIPENNKQNALFKWVIADTEDEKREAHQYVFAQSDVEESRGLSQVLAFEEVQKTDNLQTVCDLIEGHSLSHEMIPNTWFRDEKNRVAVWRALLGVNSGKAMPMTAMFRNLGRMASYGMIPQMGENDVLKFIIEQMTNQKKLIRARVHPITILQAWKTYQSGSGFRGDRLWPVNNYLLDAFGDAFDLSFGAVEPMNKRVMFGIDVSGSMTWCDIQGLTNVNPLEAATAMAMVSVHTEPYTFVGSFNREFERRNITRKSTFNDAINIMSRWGGGGTDCAQPMIYARDNKIEVDLFAVYTDNETWANPRMHPYQALQRYRDAMGIDARLVTVGMTSNGFTIADPNDSGMLDVVGFDTSTPNIISAFGRGEI